MFGRHIAVPTARLLAVCIMALSFCFALEAQQATSGGENPLNRIGWLVGDWIAADQGPNGVPLSVRLEAKWSDDKTAILVSCTRTPSGQKTDPLFQATFKWDAQKKKIVVTETRANGDRFEGDVTPAGHDFFQVGRLTPVKGSAQDVQMTYSQWATGTLNIETTPAGPDFSSTGTSQNLVFLLQKSSSDTATSAAGDPVQ
jgi:hypothetical protein